MAMTPGIKSHGMKFAEQQLQRHGWTAGKGLGKRESGISEAIKVKVKCDTAGVGHNSAEQFTFHWWDHVFNKTASGISVEPDQDGVQVKKIVDVDPAVTNKKPRKALTNPDMLYGRFIKSATLLSGGEKPVEKEFSSDSSEDEDEKLDLSSATKLTDEDLVKICGGRTAHKGARHGLTMSAKLSRIEEQEQAFLEKYRKKEPTKEPVRPSSGVSLDKGAETGGEKAKHKRGITNEDISNTSQHKKKKRQKTVNDEETLKQGRTNSHEEHVPWREQDTGTSKRHVDKGLVDVFSSFASSNKKTVDKDKTRELNHGHFTEEDLTYSKKKKKGEGVKAEADDLEDHTGSIGVQSSKKKKRKVEKDEVREKLLNGHQECDPAEDLRLSKKKKKSRTDPEDGSEHYNEPTEEYIHSGKKNMEDGDEHVSTEEEQCQIRKKKKSKNKYRDCCISEEDHATAGAEHKIKCNKRNWKD